MPTVTSLLYYSAPLTPPGRDDDWCIDALSRPPEVLFNFRKVGVETPITDLRHSTLTPRLDDMGFHMTVHPTAVDQRDLLADSRPAYRRYRQETAELLTALTGADEVRFFDATVRHQDAGDQGDPSYQSPHLRVHVDQSPRSAWARVAGHDGAPRAFRRFQIVNVWRPLVGPVRNYPLALCDYRSLDLTADLVPTRLRFPAWLKDRENYSVRHNPAHRWYYWGSLTPDEVVLFKCYDSASRGLAPLGGEAARSGLLDVAGLSPHTAFYDETAAGTGHLRTSLEMRALVFHH
uniref:CmcJ protein n=1 Tax=Streptantibioticus cattleyicolor (strain ATCC 35852 / DSM 46488 / JCM 4925 / NBRC 14057 / NRRL 8057) TaxID=1003195 RepID=F8LFQ5_STREN|nr:CmcJ protein [Streptantibioticus cattleyicolor NRRL 8057 = DSM 46488]